MRPTEPQSELRISSLTNIRSVDEAEEIEKSDYWHDHKIRLQPYTSFGGTIKLLNWLTISGQIDR